MATMYELTNNYQQVLALLEESDDQQVIQDTLESIQGGIEDKGVSYGIVAKELDGRIDMADKEIKRLQAYRKRLAINKKHMSQFLLNSMNVASITAIENVKATIKIRKNPVKMVVTDEAVIPDKFFAIHEVHALDKAKLKDALKQGEIIKGAHLEQGESLRIS